MDGSKICHTEWKKSERKTISYINAYRWNLEEWYRWAYSQSKIRDSDIENKSMDTKGERSGMRGLEIGSDTYTLLILHTKYTTDGDILYIPGNSTHCDDLNGREIQKGGDICMCRTDSFCYAVGANITL